MSKRRRMTLEGKQEQVLNIFYETRDVFQLKDLEKLAPKKGVISQSVKDVVQNLVDDDLVFKDKIGTSVYFWSLPSCAGNDLRQCRKALEAELESAEKRQLELESELELAKKARGDSVEREAALMGLADIEKIHKALQAELGLYAENDPAVYQAMRNASDIAHKAVNRWTDNIFALQRCCNNTFPEAKETLQQAYAEVGLTEDFDYLDV